MQYKSKKCPTRLCKRYGSKPGYQLDENLTLTDDWDQVKPHLNRPAEGRAPTAERAAAAWSQIRDGHRLSQALARPDRFFPSFLSKMHEERGNFCIFLLKIAEKEGKTDETSVS